MLFASGLFLYYFLPLFLALYYLSPKRSRTLVLALASYVFYGWWRPDFVVLMWISTVVDFTCGKRIEKARNESGSEHDPRIRAGKPWLVLSLCLNLGLLAYFKYANFGVETLNELLAQLGWHQVSWTRVVLPVGISFYTFQTLSYTVDVYRGSAPPVRSFRDFACYVAMFPQLVAGPIVRYNTVAEQLHSRSHTPSKFYAGILFFQAGLAKKVLLADIVGSVADDAFTSTAGVLSSLDAWMGTIAYTLQIYFDFSGYSDMAIGLGLMLGFRLPINFNSPYRSVDITDFWRRWHISLSAFLRDYLYIPLGGNRKGPIRTYVNLVATMLLGGLWHGAAWTFIAWGAYQGFWLIAERRLGRRGFWGFAPKPFKVLLTSVAVLVGWVLFRADNMTDALHIIESLAGVTHDSGPARLVLARPIHFITGAVGLSLVWFAPTTQDLVKRLPIFWVLALQFFFLWALVHLHFEDHVPFLYFQF